MRPHASFRNYCRRRPGWSDEWIFHRTKDTEGQEFGDVTSLVNALRNRRAFQFASVRLLAELAEVMRGSQPRPRRRTAPPSSNGLLDSDWLLIRRARPHPLCLFRSLNANHPTSTCHGRPMIHGEAFLRAQRTRRAGRRLAHPCRGDRQPVRRTRASVVPTRHARARCGWGKQVRLAKPVGNYAALIRALIGTIPRRRKDEAPPLLHIVLAVRGPARRLPAGFAKPPGFEVDRTFTADVTAGYDRIVYLTDAAPGRAPAEWVKLLAKAVRWRNPAIPDANGPYFCSFITALVRTPAPRR
jgi:hypothetical protein